LPDNKKKEIEIECNTRYGEETLDKKEIDHIKKDMNWTYYQPKFVEIQNKYRAQLKKI
jgi:hypothetical protein